MEVWTNRRSADRRCGLVIGGEGRWRCGLIGDRQIEGVD